MRMSDASANAEFDWLPVTKLREIASGLRHSYKSALPFPHIFIDGLFDPDLLHRIVERFPSPDQMSWEKYQNQTRGQAGFEQGRHIQFAVPYLPLSSQFRAVP